MNPIHGKSWGATQLIFATPNVEVHRIEIVPGGYCSEHFHKAKVNRFYVESGRLDILVWHGTEPDVTHLAAGQMTDVAPGLWHMFKARSAVVAWEIYWAESIASDIERRGIGGVEPAPDGAVYVSSSVPDLEMHE